MEALSTQIQAVLGLIGDLIDYMLAEPVLSIKIVASIVVALLGVAFAFFGRRR